jgi:hypothetical protein
VKEIISKVKQIDAESDARALAERGSPSPSHLAFCSSQFLLIFCRSD